MAITWGGWAMRDAYYGQRVGIDLTRSGNTFTAKYYVATKGSVYYNGLTLARSGAITGGVSFNWNTGGDSQMLVNTATKTGSPGNSYTFGASVALPWWGGKCSVSRSGAIPDDAPGAPTSVVATRNSDTQATITWNYGSNVVAVAVERWSYQDPTWRMVVTLNPAKKSWTDTSLKPNDRYGYRVRTGNSAGDSAWVLTSRFSTTPAAPSGVVAVKNADGSITVTWQSNCPYDGSGFRIYDNGTQVGSVPAGTFTWTHASPSSSVAHTYTVVMTEDDPALVSAQSAPSNTVQLLAAPSAPGSLQPNGSALPVEEGAVTLQWVHTPVDSSTQTSAQVQWRPQGGAWTTVTVTGPAQSVTVTLDTVGVFEWQARTQGAFHQGQADGWSPWSAIATVRLASTPGVSISTPDDSGTVGTSTLTVAWSWFQAEGSAQAGAEVQLLQDPGDGSDPLLVESRTVSGAGTTLLLQTRLADQGAYQLLVRGRSGDGLWSPWDQSVFTIAYPSPLQPLVTVDWDPQMGAAVVTITNLDPAALTVLQAQVDETGRPYVTTGA